MGGSAQVVGLSCDSVYSLKAWAASLGGLNFPLLSDFWPHGEVALRYGVLGELSGRPERSIIIIDASGVIRYIDVHELSEVPDMNEIAEEIEKAI